jgi:hypothetical protein
MSNDREIGDELVLGKNADTQMLPNQLGQPYMDVVLSPGDVLYVPRGVIHATSTLGERSTGDDRSSHLTAGIDAFHGLNTAAVLGGKMGWLSHTKNHSFLHQHLPLHLAPELQGSSYPAQPDPPRPAGVKNGAAKAKAKALKQAFDSMLGADSGSSADSDVFPPSAEAGAARCGNEESESGEGVEGVGGGHHYLVDVLCELGRGMHAWQAMASVLSDKSLHPSNEEWAAALQDNGGADPRKGPWQPEEPKKTAFEKTLEAMGGGLGGGGGGLGGGGSVVSRSVSPLGLEWDSGRRAEIVWAMSHDFWSPSKDMADYLPQLQATLMLPPTDAAAAAAGAAQQEQPQETKELTDDEKKQAAYEAMMARRAQEKADVEAAERAAKPKKERKKRVRKKAIEYEDDDEL